MVRVVLVAGCLCVSLSLDARSRPADAPQVAKRTKLNAAERRALANCLRIIRGCQLRDGAFVQVSRGPALDAPVWVAPYFVNYAALALLAGYQYDEKANAADPARLMHGSPGV